MTDLGTRYGRPNPVRRRLLVAGTVVLGLVFLGWLAWVMLDQGDPEATSQMRSFEVVDEHTATATFRVSRRAPDVKASCLVRAQARDHAVVGELNVDVGPGDDLVQTLTRSVRTEREATTVDMVGCVSEGQSRRR